MNIYLNTVDIEKLKLLDKLFFAMSIEQLQEMTEKEEIVNVLKGKSEYSTELLTRLYESNNYLSNDISALRQRVDEQQAYFRRLTELLHTTVFTHSSTPVQEFNQLKSQVFTRSTY